MLAKHGGELVANDLDNLLIGRKLQHDFAANRFRADIGQQFVSHANVDVAFQQRFANFCQRGVQVLVRELALPAQVLERALQLLCEVFKHSSLQVTQQC